MSIYSKNNKLWESEYKKLLNKKDPLDKLILELAESGELKVDAVEVKEGNKNYLKKYSRDLLLHRGKHTS